MRKFQIFYMPSNYVIKSKIKNLLVDEGETQLLRITGQAKPVFYKMLDDAIEKIVKDFISSLPRKIKGSNKGKLIRHTIKLEDFDVKSDKKN